MSFSSQFAALSAQEIERRAREAKMQNALDILGNVLPARFDSEQSYARFVRRTAREGLGRET